MMRVAAALNNLSQGFRRIGIDPEVGRRLREGERKKPSVQKAMGMVGLSLGRRFKFQESFNKAQGNEEGGE